MKYASITVLALALLPSAVVIACASGNESELFTGAGGAGGATSADTASSSSGPVCVPSCKTDSDCQNSCPPAGTASNCCDPAIGICFISNTTICPAPVVDAGPDGMPPY